MDVFGQIGFLGMLTVVSALQGILLSVFLMFRSGDEAGPSEATHSRMPALRWLALLIMLMSLHLLDTTFAKTGFFQYYVLVADSTFCLLFLIGPLYYFYVRSLLLPKLGFRWRDLLHALPALYILLGMMPWLMTDPQLKIEWKIRSQSAAILNIPVSVYYQLLFNILQNIAYLALSLSLIKKTRIKLSRHSADGAVTHGLDALQMLTRAFASWVGVYLVFFAAIVLWGQFGAQIDHFWLFVNGLFIQAGGFAALSRPALFSSVMLEVNSETKTVWHTDTTVDGYVQKYGKSKLREEDRSSLKAAFENLMSDERLYLDPGLRMPDVAAKIGTSPHHFSQMLNQDVGLSFFGVINRYRVAEVKAQMGSPSGAGQSVLALAFAAGFNNKNSFNRAFRAETGVTPSAYRRSIKPAP